MSGACEAVFNSGARVIVLFALADDAVRLISRCADWGLHNDGYMYAPPPPFVAVAMVLLAWAWGDCCL